MTLASLLLHRPEEPRRETIHGSDNRAGLTESTAEWHWYEPRSQNRLCGRGYRPSLLIVGSRCCLVCVAELVDRCLLELKRAQNDALEVEIEIVDETADTAEFKPRPPKGYRFD